VVNRYRGTLIDRGGFRHVQHARTNRGPTKRDPHRPQNVGQQCNIFWPVLPLYGVLRHI